MLGLPRGWQITACLLDYPCPRTIESDTPCHAYAVYAFSDDAFSPKKAHVGTVASCLHEAGQWLREISPNIRHEPRPTEPR
jgi:hypothetical protein